MITELNYNKGFLGSERLAKGPWQSFERAIARMLVHNGWEVSEVVGGTGDKGADIIASYKHNDKFFDFVYQVKFSENNKPISVNIIGDLVSAMEFYQIQNGVAVSNRLLSDKQILLLNSYKNKGYVIDTFLSRDIETAYYQLPDWPIERRVLKKYQSTALGKLQQKFSYGDKRGLVCLATGLGKTFVAATFIRWLIEIKPAINILILAHTKPLIEQFERSIWSNIPKWISTHLLYDSEKPSFDEGILLSTFQSFEQYREKTNTRFDVVIVDEAHHSMAATYKKVLDDLHPEFLLGLTATPFRGDEKNINVLFGEPVINLGVYKALKKGYLAKVDYNLFNDNIDEDWITRNSEKGHTIKQLNKKVFLPERDEYICEKIFQTWQSEKLERGIIFCNSTLHAEKIEGILKSSYELPVWSLTTKVKTMRERSNRLRQFRTGRCKLLTCYDMLNEGVDVPDVDFIVFLRVTHSRIYFLQQLGRGLRYKEGKTLLVHDFVADIRRVKRVTDFRDQYESESRTTENLFLEPPFELKFSSTKTANFLDLVTKDLSEEQSEDEIISYTI